MASERKLKDSDLDKVAGGGLASVGGERNDHKEGIGGGVNEVEGQDPPSNTPGVPGQSG